MCRGCIGGRAAAPPLPPPTASCLPLSRELATKATNVAPWPAGEGPQAEDEEAQAAAEAEARRKANGKAPVTEDEPAAAADDDEEDEEEVRLECLLLDVTSSSPVWQVDMQVGQPPCVALLACWLAAERVAQQAPFASLG